MNALSKNLSLNNIYIIILCLFTVFTYLTTQNFYLTKNRLENFAKEKRDYIVHEIKESIFSTIKDKIKNLENSAKFLTLSSPDSNIEELKEITNIFFGDGLLFDSVQIYVNDQFFYAKSIRESVIIDDTEPIRFEDLKKRSWYKNTLSSKQTTITVMGPHELLGEKTLNICTPIVKQENFYGILCGVIEIGSFFKNISQTIKYPYQIDYFLGDKDGNILKTSDPSTKKAWEKSLKKKVKASYFEIHEFEFEQDFIKVYPFEQFNWQVGVSIEKDTISEDSIEQFMTISIVLFFIFVFLVALVFATYVYLRRKAKFKQKEYEYLLSHRARMNEIGELISSINHQLTQPINSLSLLLSNTIALSKNEILDKEVLEGNLKLCHDTTKNITETIIIFKDFYKNSEIIEEFLLEMCVLNVLQVMHIELTKNNIKVTLKDIENIKINSIENYLQQILLVLIQNAKDVLVNKEDISDREITISAIVSDEMVDIKVADCGDGISKEIQSTLFSRIKTSKDKAGSGIGLYFSKKLAKEKLGGDLNLISVKKPTIFSLSIAKNLNIKSTK